MSGGPLLSSPVVAAAGGFTPALITFLVYTLAVFSLAIIANYLRRGGSFLNEERKSVV